MRIDQPYLKRLLNVFLDSENHFTQLSEFGQAGFEIDDKFLFHFRILEDQKFIESSLEDKDLGYKMSIGGTVHWHSKILRLTASGHDFAETINRIEVFEILSTEFKNASVSTLSTVAKELMLGFAKKQVKKYFDPDA